MSADMRRELAKALDALRDAETYLARHAEMNAALHRAKTVHHSPLHATVATAITGIELALERSGDTLDDDGGTFLRAVLMDLDRCDHGRHEGDACGDCGGVSLGNRIAPAGTVLGHGIGGPTDLIVMPTRDRKHDPAAWRQRDGGRG